MRPSLRHSTAVLGIMAPLAALAWIGSVELGRQSDRAEQAMADHASTFLGDASRLLEAEVTTLTAGVTRELRIEFRPLVAVERQLLTELPLTSGLFALDRNGDLVYPTGAPPDGPELPFHGWEPTAEVRTAEQLIALEDLDGAREVLESYLRSSSRRALRSFRSRQRAEFRLATVARRLGDLETAELHFVAAGRGRFGAPEGDAIGLLCDVALAEIDALRDGSPARLVAMMSRIANGEHYVDVGDGLLAETMLYLGDQVPAGTDDAAAAAEALEIDAVRRAGRAFAIDYRAYSSESVRRQLRTSARGGRWFSYHDGATSSALLVLREVRDSEREQALGTLDDAAWIGVRFDIEPLLRRALEPLLVPTTEAFFLAIESPDATPILPPEPATGTPGGDLLPRHRSIAGLVLRAEPADPSTFAAQRSASIRNRALLLAALCVAALGATLLLVRSVARESEVAELKLALVSRVSHELKTPLALIKMYAETLEQGRTTSAEQTVKFSAIISREADRLTAMIQRVLDVSRRESGEAEFQPEATDLAELTREVTRAYRPNALSRGIDLCVTVEDGLVAKIDRDAYESAVLNLLDNAVKYTGQAGRDAPVEVGLRRDRGNAVLEVADRGVGIPADELERVFESFHRARNAGEAPGAGLGLSLVRGFARGHGGDVVARRRADEGTVFRMTIPLVDDEP